MWVVPQSYRYVEKGLSIAEKSKKRATPRSERRRRGRGVFVMWGPYLLMIFEPPSSATRFCARKNLILLDTLEPDKILVPPRHFPTFLFSETFSSFSGKTFIGSKRRI